MKLLDSWKDDYNNISNKIYQLDNKVKLIHSENPNTLDFDFSIIIKGGSYYERQVGVPQGTAHLLEHIIAANPNNLFKTRSEIDNFTYGTRTRPSIDHNASTSREYIYIYAHSNFKAWKEVIDFNFARVNYPLDNIEKFIEKERLYLERFKEGLKKIVILLFSILNSY
ncbi:MAG: hypothetical protein Q9M91_07360 [Candidatus Dojkabacteria bacterium]|nr:hypothetical protein [Candidatus Dojkabacteria bacterium]MDQ7021605.1 hypothetical protein [Candidatus Dojkabacteria bacterium]